MEEWMLNDLLECSVCLERLDISSRVLPCQHTFCKKCLEEIITTHKELRCPECRILVTTKLEDLPPNVLLMRILEGMKNVPKTKQTEDTQAPNHQQSNQDTSQNANIQAAIVSNPQPQQQVQQPQRPLQPSIHPEIHPKIETTPKVPVSLQQPCAKALYDYMPQEPGDLGFKKGDIIILKKRIDANWYQGERNSCQGFFPASYVQVLTPLPCSNATVPQCIALYDFKMSAEDEKDCLTFNKGAVVTVIRRVDENWAEGRLADRIGIFPISFVEMNSAAKHLMKSSMNFQPGPSRSAPALPVTNLTNSLNSLSLSVTSPTPPANASNNSDSSPANPANRVVAREKRLSLNVNQQPQQQTQYNRRSADISSRNRGLTVAPSENETQPSVASAQAPPAGGPPAFITPPALYIALYPYKPQKADELELRKGALYTVSEKCQDGWYKGASVRTQKVGVFPGNYVQAVRSQPHPSITPPTSSAASQSGSTNGNQPARITSQVTVHPPPKLPPRALSPAAQVNSTPATASAFKPIPLVGSTSSSASVPAAVVARLATAPAPAPALSPRATTLVSAPPNVVIAAGAEGTTTSPAHQAEKKDKEKEKSSGVSLMKRLTSRKKSSPPLLHPYSIDNPVFEDGFQAAVPPKTTCLSPTPAPVHVRSGSCPSQLLQVLPPERVERDAETRTAEKSRHSMGGSQRLRSNKHRPNILPGNVSVFARSMTTSGPANHEATASASGVLASSGLTSPRDKEKRVRSAVSPGVTERFRCITPYPPNSEYELELRIGDVVYVHKKREDGWYKGTLHRTGKTGLFPASFVESC